jgi:hypothetical protein
VVFLRRKAASRQDRLNGTNNYMDWPSRVWSQSLADPSWIPSNESQGPTRIDRYQLTEHCVSTYEEKRGTAQAFRPNDKDA